MPKPYTSETIENIKNNNDPKNVYLCKKNEYNNYN
jgi:hypothetical protein